MLTLEISADSDYLAVLVDGKEVWRSPKLRRPHEVRDHLESTLDNIGFLNEELLGVELTYTNEGETRQVVEI